MALTPTQESDFEKIVRLMQKSDRLDEQHRSEETGDTTAVEEIGGARNEIITSLTRLLDENSEDVCQAIDSIEDQLIRDGLNTYISLIAMEEEDDVEKEND